MSSRNTKKKPKARQQSRSPSPDSDDDDRVLFYIPSLGINIEVLLFYLKIYLGDDSDAEPGQKPRVRNHITDQNAASDSHRAMRLGTT